MNTMLAARLHAIGDFRVDTVGIPQPEGKELLVKIAACGICGSDIPRIFLLGTSKQKYPLTIGHEFSGTIVKTGPDADPALVGKQGAFFPLIPCGHCENDLTGHYAECVDYDYMGSRRDGGFAEYVLVPSAWNFVEAKGAHPDMVQLAMTEPACVAQHAVRSSRMYAGANVVIFGAGPIGLMMARWAHLFGAGSVLLFDVQDEKVDFAIAHGEHAVNSLKESPVEAVKAAFDGKLADIVIEGTGAGPVLDQCIDCVRSFGTVTLVGNPSTDAKLCMKQHSSILRKELTIHGVWNSMYSSQPINEWSYTVKMLGEGKIRFKDLVTHTTNLEGLPELCGKIYRKEISICKAMYVAE